MQSVAIMRWSGEERVFAVEAYLLNRQSVIATQRAFRYRFNVTPRRPVPDRKLLLHGSLHSGKLCVPHGEELEYLGSSDHVKTLKQ